MSEKKIINDDSISLTVLLDVIYRGRKFIIAFTSIIILISLIYSLLVTPLYKSTMSMYPKESNNNRFGNLSNMVSAFGVDMSTDISSFNIPDIIKSRYLKQKLIYREWGCINNNLINYWNLNDGSKLDTEHDALEIITKRITTVESKTGLIKVAVLMEDPLLASDIANYISESVIEFTQKNHNKDASRNTKFILDRKNIAESELENSEDLLKKFRETNREITNSPELQLELDRLIRNVTVHTEKYITLLQQYELSKIEEVKETPSVILLDIAIPASKKDWPKRMLIVFISSFLGFLLSIMIYLSIRAFKINRI